MNPVIILALKIFSIIWYSCFFLIIVPFLITNVGQSLDWLFFNYLLEIKPSTSTLCKLIPLLQILGVLIMTFGVSIIIVAWYNLIKDHKFFPLTTIFRQHLSPEKLVSSGFYRHIRHPMFLGYLIILTGLGIILLSPLTILWVVPLAGYVGVKFLEETEEKELLSWFGKEYKEYKEKTPALIPRMKAPQKKLKSK